MFLLILVAGGFLLIALIGGLIAVLLLNRSQGAPVEAPPPPAPALTPEERSAVRALLAAGKQIEAITLVRSRTGLGLAEAKEYVEALG